MKGHQGRIIKTSSIIEATELEIINTNIPSLGDEC